MRETSLVFSSPVPSSVEAAEAVAAEAAAAAASFALREDNKKGTSEARSH